MTIGNIQFDTNQASTVLLGMTKGLEYDGLTKSLTSMEAGAADTVSNCFYAANGIIGQFDQIQS